MRTSLGSRARAASRAQAVVGVVLVAAGVSWLGCDEAVGGETVAPIPATICDPGETRACYDGEPATRDEGVCRGGVQACLQDGRGWGECVGQVLPVQEDCDTPTDDNCDGLASCGETVWAERWGVDQDEVAYRIAADAAGNIYVAGFYRAPFDFGAGELPALNNTRDIVVAKLSPDGELLWNVAFFGDTHLQPQDIAVSPAGDVVVLVASASGDLLSGLTTVAGQGGNDVVVARMGAEGTLEWLRRFGDESEQVPTAVGLDSENNIVLTGYFEGVLDFGGDALSSVGLELDAFVAKLDASGTAVWARSYAGPLDQVPRDLTVDALDRVVVTGQLAGHVDFGGGDRVSTGTGNDMFVLGLDAAGEHRFSRVWGGEGDDVAWAVGSGADGGAVVAGRFQERVRFGSTTLDATAAGAIVVVKLDDSGAERWARRIGGASEQSVTDLVIDSRDRVVLTGFYEGDVTFGDASLPTSGLREPNILIAKLEPDGELVWARGVVVAGNQDVGGVRRAWRSVAILPGDFIALGGFVQRAIDFGDGPLLDRGAADLFVAKLAP